MHCGAASVQVLRTLLLGKAFQGLMGSTQTHLHDGVLTRRQVLSSALGYRLDRKTLTLRGSKLRDINNQRRYCDSRKRVSRCSMSLFAIPPQGATSIAPIEDSVTMPRVSASASRGTMARCAQCGGSSPPRSQRRRCYSFDSPTRGTSGDFLRLLEIGMTIEFLD